MTAEDQGSRAVRDYFEGTGVTFDTFYDGQRTALLQWFDRHFRHDVFERFARAFEAFGDLEGKRVLDVGCGSGVYVAEALRRGAEQVVGVDLSQGMLDLARERARETGGEDRTELVRTDFLDWQTSETFDATIVMGVLDYVEDAAGFMARIAERTHGRAAVSFPSISWWRSPIRRLRYYLKRCPLYLYDPAAIERAVGTTASRLEIQKIPGAGMDYVAVLDYG